jgi:3-oxoacyl-[acyl-carrier-protein] synthase-1
MGLVTPLGSGRNDVAHRLFQGTGCLIRRDDLCAGRSVQVGQVLSPLPEMPAELRYLDCRNNRLMFAAIDQIRPAIDEAVRLYGPRRVAVVLGTSTGGMAEQEAAHADRSKSGEWRSGEHYRQWEMGALAEQAALALEVSGPAYVIATACSASAKVFASARRLMDVGLCDAAVVGGADTLCRMTVSGFSSLEAVSRGVCNPFSRNRDGINIGEGAAAFLMTRDPATVNLIGAGECSDAHHISAPDPEGSGATEAMRLALDDSGLAASDVAYVNLHGTGTPLNDSMEATAVARLLGLDVPCSSTKGMMGHALGAAGACEAAFVWLALNPEFNPRNLLPPHLWDGVRDPSLAGIHLATHAERFEEHNPVVAMLSNSFAFGGNNVCLALGRERGP